MKAIRKKNGLWKAIAFLTVVISVFSCTSCDPEDINIGTTIELGSVEVTNSSATLVAYVTLDLNTPAEALPLVVNIQYQAVGGNWRQVENPPVVGFGNKVKVTQVITGLKLGTSYNFKISVPALTLVEKTGTFKTLAASIRLGSAEKMTKTSATLVAWVTADENSTVSFHHQAENEAWQHYTLPTSFNGLEPVKVTMDLSALKVDTKYLFSVSMKNKSGEISSDTVSFRTCAVSDFDGNDYHIVTIGNQVWLQENFKGKHFANGDAIPNITDQAEWEAMKTPAYCHYDNNPANTEVYGALYNWYVASDPRGLIVGYHTPSLDEWTALANYLGGAAVAGGKMKEAGLAHWVEPNTGATNSSGFSGLPGGDRYTSFCNLKDDGIFWSTTPALGLSNVYFSTRLDESTDYLGLSGANSGFRGFSLRLVKN